MEGCGRWHCSLCQLLGLCPSLPGSVPLGGYWGLLGACPLLDDVPEAFGGWSGAGYVDCFPSSSSVGPYRVGRNQAGGWGLPVGGGDLGELTKN